MLASGMLQTLEELQMLEESRRIEEPREQTRGAGRSATGGDVLGTGAPRGVTRYATMSIANARIAWRGQLMPP